MERSDSAATYYLRIWRSAVSPLSARKSYEKIMQTGLLNLIAQTYCKCLSVCVCLCASTLTPQTQPTQ